jgi:hypothetical protein
MPTSPFMQINPPNRRNMVADTSDYTRFLRMAATIAPYVNQPGVPLPNSLGWRSQAATTDARVIAPMFLAYKSFIPNR